MITPTAGPAITQFKHPLAFKGVRDVMMDNQDAKRALRKHAAQIRQQAFEASAPAAAAALASKADFICDQFAPKSVAAYWPIKSEIDPIPLAQALMARACAIGLPITPQEGLPLAFHQWHDGEALEEGPYGTKQPAAAAPQLMPDLILAPLLAFDEAGWRLGYGGGFYDRTLADLEAKGHHAQIIGLAFDEQQVDAVPIGAYDKPLSAILTPTRFIKAQTN